jgi:hypothetical protein
MPINVCDFFYRSFIHQVVPEANKRGIAPLGMKSLGGDGRAVKERAVKASEALRYAMSLPVATTISGIDSLKVLRQNLRVAKGFTPMTRTEMAAYRRRLAEPAADGRFETYKITAQHEGDEGRSQHGMPSQEEMSA